MADNTPIGPAEPRAVSQHSRQRYENGSEKTVDVEQTPDVLVKPEDPPPDGGYGWVVVACNFFINGKNMQQRLRLSSCRYLQAKPHPDPKIRGIDLLTI